MRLIEGWPALLLEKPVKTLLLADIHFGYESELADKGIQVPSQAYRLRELLVRVVEETGAERIIFLGDLKHQVPLSSWIEWREMPEALKVLKEMGVDLALILGNHDGGIESMLGDLVTIFPSKGVMLDAEKRVYLLHGHAWPSQEVLRADLIIMGHLHPMISLRTDIGIIAKRRVWLIFEGDKKILAEKLAARRRRGSIRLIVMPAFNPILTGLSVNALTPRDRLWPLIRSGAFDLDSGEAVTLSGERLGRISFLRKLLMEGHEA
ncbi:MAG: hypothetical protein DRN59_02320 [Thaumarchaeota archaeon]|nr:MAG: hypothetical protein DRN59_02320 [Nitrososphaerota archaeon]